MINIVDVYDALNNGVRFGLWRSERDFWISLCFYPRPTESFSSINLPESYGSINPTLHSKEEVKLRKNSLKVNLSTMTFFFSVKGFCHTQKSVK